MMNEIQIFDNPEFGKIRTVEIDGEAWFVGKDVADVLGYGNCRQALKTNVPSDDKGVHLVDTPSGIQKTTVINESGLYSLIFGSKLPSAKKFKRWVTSEVLPALRKHGSYDVPKGPLDVLHLHYEAIKQVDHKVSEVDSRVDGLEEEIRKVRDDLPMFGIEETQIIQAVEKRAIELLGGRRSNAFKNKGLKRSVSTYIYGELHRVFGVKTYKALKRKDSGKAMYIIRSYEPPKEVRSRIEEYNAQLKLNLTDRKGEHHG